MSGPVLIADSHNIIVISSPSGGGKTTLVQRLLSEKPNFQLVISHTTRNPRLSEKNAESYFFIDRNEFESKIENGEFLEWAVVHGNYYGTSKKEVKKLLKSGIYPILEIDVQGFHQIKKLIPDSQSIFIFPPTIQKLWERLEKRGSEEFNVRVQRLKNALEEISSAEIYSSYIVNDDVEKAFKALIEILDQNQESRRKENNISKIAKNLLAEFKDSPLIKDLNIKIP